MNLNLSQITNQLTLVNILSLVVIDLVLGICIAIKNKQFDLRRVADTISSNILPYVIPIAVFQIFLPILQISDVFLKFTIGIYGTKLVMECKDKLLALYNTLLDK